MSYILNLALIVVILIAVAVLLYVSFKRVEAEEYESDTSEDTDILTIDYLVEEVAQAIARTIRRNVEYGNLTKEEVEKRQQRISDLRESINGATLGDLNDKNVIKTHIESILTQNFAVNTDAELEKLIPFNHPDKLTGNDLFEILAYVYNKHFELDHTKDGITELFQEYQLYLPVKDKDGEDIYTIDKMRIYEVYKSVLINHESEIIGHYELSTQDKKAILVQRIYEKLTGRSVIDLLIESTIDEIMGGTSGVPANLFKKKKGMNNLPYSWESIWILYRGILIYMKCLTFETEEEFIRVCDNIYKYQASHVLSRSEPAIQGTTLDGSRIVVARDPMVSSRSFFLRKFDSVDNISLHQLFRNNAFDYVVIFFLKWAIKSELTTIITGATGSGKTTIIKGLVRYINNLYGIRVYEKQFELNLNFLYPEKNIVSFQEGGNMTEQDCLDFGKKTMGVVSIIGEIANMMQASYFVQTTNVVSRFGLASHHGETTESAIDAIAQNLVEAGIYSNKTDAIRAVCRVINIDCHVSNIKGNRHVERISEVIPLDDQPYPTDDGQNDNLSLMDQTLLDSRRYMRDVTNKQCFKVVDLVVWKPDDEEGITGHYEVKNLPSKKLLQKMRRKMMLKEEKQFLEEMVMLYIQNHKNLGMTPTTEAYKKFTDYLYKGSSFEKELHEREFTQGEIDAWVQELCK